MNKHRTVAMIFIVLFLLSSCSKEVRINRNLDGRWSLQSINGTDLPTQYLNERTYSFIKTDKKGGNVSMSTKSWNAGDYNFNGTYALENKNELKLVLTDDYGNPLSIHYTVKEFSRKEIVLKTTNGDEYKLVPM